MPSSDSEDSFCHICGAKLDPSLLGGGCSACMWSDLVNSDGDNEELVSDAPEIEGYQVLEEIGSGGMGVVYRARQLLPEREVALKIVAPYSLRASQARQRFMLEVEAMAAVEHPTLLPLYDAGEDENGRPWLTMQLAQGGTLSERIDGYSADWRKTAQLLISLCRAVQYAHERGILHRDLKPANILFDEENNPYIADFGLAKWADQDSSITRSSYLLGSPAYLAPEAAAGGSKVTTTVSDVYGLGAVLYEMLCGKKPYEGTVAAEILTQILDRAPVSPRARLSNIPRDLEVIVMKAMAREPEKRYHSAAAFADDLNRWLEGKPILARPVGQLERAWIWARRNPALSILSLLLLTSILTGGILLWRANQELTIALNDAEDRVDFMTRELPPALQPLGRLELLDNVFENVSEHYQMDHRTDSQSLARHADFLTQWSQILRPRGRVQESIERLEQALVKADAATAGNSYSIEAARARMNTGRRLGEALIEAKQYPRAKQILDDTMTFGKSARAMHPQDLRLSSLTADAMLETAIAELYEDRFEQAKNHADAAANHWKSILPELLKNPNNPHNQIALTNSVRVHFFLWKTASGLNNEEDQTLHLDDFLNASKQLLDIAPDNSHFRHEYIIARMRVVERRVETGTMPLAQAMLMLKEADADAVLLTEQAPSNVRWRTDALHTADNLAQIATKQSDPTQQRHWMEVLEKRLNPIYKLHPTDIAFLTAHRNAAAFCAVYFEEYNWPQARHHFNAAYEIQKRICHLESNEANHLELCSGMGNITLLWEKHESQAATITWIKDIENYCKKQSSASTDPDLWLWTISFCYRYISLAKPDEPELLSAQQKCFDIIISLVEKKATISTLSFDTMRAASNLLSNKTIQPAKRADTILKSLQALPNVRKKQDPAVDEQWLTLILKHIPQLDREQQRKIANKSMTLFFPKADQDNSRYQQLKEFQ